LYFSKNGNAFTGFIVYDDNGKVISKIKMGSFLKNSGNVTLARDLIDFVGAFVEKRELITWNADTLNTEANKQYEKLLNRKGFHWSRDLTPDKRDWIYNIKGKFWKNYWESKE
jgi:hypothetical protein